MSRTVTCSHGVVMELPEVSRMWKRYLMGSREDVAMWIVWFQLE